MVEGGLRPRQNWSGRRYRLWVPWVHQFLFQIAEARQDQGLGEVALVERPPVVARRRLEGRRQRFLWREEGQAGLRELPLKPGEEEEDKKKDEWRFRALDL